MIRFGTGGWRAVIGEEFVRDNICRVGQGVADLIWESGKQKQPVIIGYDRRFLSDSAARWLAETLVGNGIRVLFLNRSAPTPLIMHTVQKRKLSFGLEVTASHNPSEYNGIKLIVEEGRDAPVETTARLEELIEAAQVHTMDFDEAVRCGMIEYVKNPFNPFIDDIMRVMDVEAIRERGPRILFDPMHGSGTYPLMVILYSARCTLDVINVNKDAYFGGYMPAPSEAGLKMLTNTVVKDHYDLGIAVDGDGDRLGIIDSNGRYVSANEILCMLYYYLHVYKGWTASVNGADVPLLRADYGFMTAAVSPGGSTVELRYHTPGLSAGMAISAGSLVIFAIVFIALQRKKEKK